jgi:LacI family transcriptional regulator
MAQDKKDLQGRPTSVDVARLAGVSRTQVSYVLSGKRSKHVSPEKRERILEAVKTLGYEPHFSAQALRSGHSNEFTLFFPAPYPNFINSLLGTIHEAAPDIGCIITQYSYNAQKETPDKQTPLKTLLSRRPIGIFTSLFDIGEEEIALIQQARIPHVLFLGIDPHPTVTTLRLPVEQTGAIVADHLLSQGHRAIGILQPPDVTLAYAYTLRVRGMHRAMEAYPDASLLELPWPIHEFQPSLEAADLFIDSIRRSTDPMTALYAFNDDFALPVMAKLMDRGYRIPEDMAVVGTDDSPASRYFRPALSSVRFDLEEVGSRAVAIIKHMSRTEAVPENLLTPPVPLLIHRSSS